MNDTIELLEQAIWGEPDSRASYLVKQCHLLRKKELSAFTAEGYRLLLGQNIALEILVPRVLEFLKANPFVSGDFYEGDLLNTLLQIESGYWLSHPEHKAALIALFEANQPALDELEMTKRIKESMRNAYEQLRR